MGAFLAINRKGSVFFFGGLFIFTGFLFLVLKLWEADLKIPFGYDGDFLSASSVIKSILDHGWYIINPSLGAPFHLNMNDYPLGGDNFNFLIIKMLSLYSHDYAIVTNLFFLLSFYFAYISSYWVMRLLKIHFILSIFGSILFAFMPYHFFRANGGHLFLAFYFMIPFVVLVSLRMFENKIDFMKFRNKDYFTNNIVVIIVAIIVGSTGIYYAFFAGFFWFVSSLFTSLNRKNRNIFFSGLISIGIIFFILIVNLSPSIYSKIVNEPNSEAAVRSAAESEILGLKIDQILLPIQGHRFKIFDDISRHYAATAPLVNENSSVSLGILGSLGFLMLLFFLFYTPKNFGVKIKNMSLLNIAAILIATIGGFSYVIAAVITPSIRGYNRIIPYIGFMSILGVIILFQYWLFKYKKKNLFYLILSLQVVILVFGIWDQTSPQYVPNYSSLKERYTIDAAFYKEVENKLSNGDSTFQLPYVSFPEYPYAYINKMGNYDHLRGYLHTSTVRWSFGAMKGTKEDLIIRSISNESVSKMIESVAYADYSGVLINRDGYSDNKVEQEIADKLRVTPLVSEDGKLAFYDIRKYKKTLVAKGNWEEKRDLVLNPILTKFYDGFYDQEKNETMTWRWSDREGKIDLINTSDKSKTVNVSGYYSSGFETTSILDLSSPLFQEKIKINSSPTYYKKTLNLQPGVTTITFKSSADKLVAPNDPRSLYFRLDNFTIEITK